MLTPDAIDQLALRLHQARAQRQGIDHLTREHPDLTPEEAYRIQAAGARLRQKAGERVIGFKLGLTSQAKQEQMGLHSPVYGVLTDRMQREHGGTAAVAEGIHPKIEPEIAFRIGRQLRGRVTQQEARAAIAGVAPAMEILDSRYREFKYFSLPDVIADNSSSFAFVVGRFVPLGDQPLDRLGMAMSVDGAVKQQARSDAISGDPLVSLVQLCALLEPTGQGVPEGAVVMTGAATVAEPLVAGQTFTLKVEALGEVTIRAV